MSDWSSTVICQKARRISGSGKPQTAAKYIIRSRHENLICSQHNRDPGAYFKILLKEAYLSFLRMKPLSNRVLPKLLLKNSLRNLKKSSSNHQFLEFQQPFLLNLLGGRLKWIVTRFCRTFHHSAPNLAKLASRKFTDCNCTNMQRAVFGDRECFNLVAPWRSWVRVPLEMSFQEPREDILRFKKSS